MTDAATAAPPDTKAPLSLVTYYRCTLALPILLPAALTPALSHLADAGWWSGVAFILVMGAAIAGVPYLVLAGILFFAARNRTGWTLRWLALAAPVMLVPLYILWAAGLGLLTEPRGARAPFFEDPSLYLIVLVVAYGYVMVVELMRFGGERMGWLGDTTAAP